LDEKTYIFIICLSTQKKLHKDIGFDGNVYSMQGQAALTTVSDIRKESFSS